MNMEPMHIASRTLKGHSFGGQPFPQTLNPEPLSPKIASSVAAHFRRLSGRPQRCCHSSPEYCYGILVWHFLLSYIIMLYLKICYSLLYRGLGGLITLHPKEGDHPEP